MYLLRGGGEVTLDDVVVRAIKELNGSLEVVNNLLEIETYKYEADSYQAKWQWHLKQLILTHLAEFEEHENYWAYCCEECNGDDLGCKTCSGTYPCQIAELKAKRLMGEE